jgi:hypothetical protein
MLYLRVDPSAIETREGPPIVLRVDGKDHYGYEAIIDGPARLVFKPEMGPTAGSRAFIETEGHVELIKYDENI